MDSAIQFASLVRNFAILSLGFYWEMFGIHSQFYNVLFKVLGTILQSLICFSEYRLFSVNSMQPQWETVNEVAISTVSGL